MFDVTLLSAMAFGRMTLSITAQDVLNTTLLYVVLLNGALLSVMALPGYHDIYKTTFSIMTLSLENKYKTTLCIMTRSLKTQT
jgi:hypothetical protein